MRIDRVTRLWIGAFVIWGILLTGIFSGMGGSPGIIQSFSLHSILTEKQIELTSIEAEVEKTDAESAILEKSSRAQEKEVRKTLGYVGSDEIIFDFSSSRTALLRD